MREELDFSTFIFQPRAIKKAKRINKAMYFGWIITLFIGKKL